MTSVTHPSCYIVMQSCTLFVHPGVLVFRRVIGQNSDKLLLFLEELMCNTRHDIRVVFENLLNLLLCCYNPSVKRLVVMHVTVVQLEEEFEEYVGSILLYSVVLASRWGAFVMIFACFVNMSHWESIYELHQCRCYSGPCAGDRGRY
jgi:hypothetical protein